MQHNKNKMKIKEKKERNKRRKKIPQLAIRGARKINDNVNVSFTWTRWPNQCLGRCVFYPIGFPSRAAEEQQQQQHIVALLLRTDNRSKRATSGRTLLNAVERWPADEDHPKRLPLWKVIETAWATTLNGFETYSLFVGLKRLGPHH